MEINNIPKDKFYITLLHEFIYSIQIYFKNITLVAVSYTLDFLFPISLLALGILHFSQLLYFLMKNLASLFYYFNAALCLFL